MSEKLFQNYSVMGLNITDFFFSNLILIVYPVLVSTITISAALIIC